MTLLFLGKNQYFRVYAHLTIHDLEQGHFRSCQIQIKCIHLNTGNFKLEIWSSIKSRMKLAYNAHFIDFLQGCSRETGKACRQLLDSYTVTNCARYTTYVWVVVLCALRIDSTTGSDRLPRHTLVKRNLSAVRSVPGRSFNTTRCRHPGCNETETLGHVLGFCRKTELLRNNRHHKARAGIADVLKRRGWEVYEEIHCISSLDSNRRADIVAIHRTHSKGIVLDPTIRFETDALKAQHVDEEKKSI
ncbi:hypothetical protein ANN_09206 [Periplaneta americana]|uniref:Uncharacterized protein n=1 Tax=Periplaneta americana TaxID=6978 RepID=A0ABQ8TKQ9_PERAM|nr:hypothetical protein ANN_09206 [Periplaneta americana]